MTQPGDQTNPPPATAPPATEPAQQPPAPPAPRPVVVTPPATDQSGLSEVLAAVRALPETLVNAFNESVKPAVTPPSTPEQPAASATTPPTTPETPAATQPTQRGNRFTNWWFGNNS